MNNLELRSLMNLQKEDVHMAYRVLSGEIELKNVSHYGEYDSKKISTIIGQIQAMEARLHRRDTHYGNDYTRLTYMFVLIILTLCFAAYVLFQDI